VLISVDWFSKQMIVQCCWNTTEYFF